MKSRLYTRLITIAAAFVIGGCTVFLDEKPDISMVVPSTLADLQGLLDDTVLRNMNAGSGSMIISADDLKITDQGFATRTLLERQLYTWDRELLLGSPTFIDWSVPYQQIFNANLVMDRLINIVPNGPEEEVQKQHIKGRALFYRAMAFHNLMEMFCMPYDVNTASVRLGIPLRTSSNLNILVPRSTLEETLRTILRDLIESVDLLPSEMGVVTRPSKSSAYALLARLSMIEKNYSNAVEYAKSSILLSKGLIDYNARNAALTIPFPFNDNHELLFHQSASSFGQIAFNAESLVNEEIIQLYSPGDLRRNIFFMNRPRGLSFKGNYSGQVFWFTGLALDEVYLNLTESMVRVGNLTEAREYLNEFLQKRFVPAQFSPITENNPQALLEIVKNERRKTLLFRPVRWMDIRRYNQDLSEEKILIREVNEQVIVLPPHSPNYALPIPENDILLGSLEQNKRD